MTPPTDYEWIRAFRRHLMLRDLRKGAPGWRAFATGVAAGAALIIASLMLP